MEENKYLRFFGVVGLSFGVFLLVGFFHLKRRMRNCNLGNESYFRKMGFIQPKFLILPFYSSEGCGRK